MGEANRDLVLAHHTARTHVVELVELVRGLDGMHNNGGSHNAPLPTEELARLVRLEWQMQSRLQHALHAAEELRAERDQYRDQAERLAESERIATVLQARLSTRRYRVASLLAAPLDWLRGR